MIVCTCTPFDTHEIDPDCPVHGSIRAADAEAVLREIHDNSSGQIADPHFRHWVAVTIASYFSAQSVGEK
jgi:hypothetical protein